ncbi:MAG: DUF4982 domain-containing protein [Clostridia bacterium]|nr:DUF4982 domain-containing protein [Clostridia bacterium]
MEPKLQWRFHLGEAEEAWYQGYDDGAWRAVTLPHDWAVEAEFSQEYSSGTGYLPAGVGWYRGRFTLTGAQTTQAAHLTFEGVYNNAQVWINSNYLGKRPYGYSSFTYEISDYLKAGENVIAVKVSHLHDADSRWYTGSGVYRPVRLTVGDRPFFLKDGRGVFCRTVAADAESATLAVDFALSGAGTAQFALSDGGVLLAQARTDGQDGTLRLTVPVPKLWSPAQPHLYTLHCAAFDPNGRQTDSLRIPVGIRTFRFDADTGFYLNGTPMKLRGVCVHHDAGALGAAFFESVWERRLQTLRACGCNAIRTSHNPPAPQLLDLCDRLGFLVMDEAFDEWEGCKNKWWHGHNVYPPKHYGYYEDFPQWHEADLAAMVLRDRNHPSVILWSIGNEIDYPNDPYVHHAFEIATGNNDANKPEQERRFDRNKPDAKRLTAVGKELAAIIKKHDATRPVTAALAFPEMSEQIGLTDALDVVGYNYKETLYEAHRAAHPARVILGSENGHTAEQWHAVRDRADISAQFLWTGIDYLGECSGWPWRASGAGILDLAGFPKARYYHRKALWSDTLTAALASEPAGTRWQERAQWNHAPGAAVNAIVYTNAETVELFLNGVSLGKKTLTDADGCCVKWPLAFEAGALHAVCRRGEETVAATLSTAGVPSKLTLAQVETQARDLIQIEALLTDACGVPAAEERDVRFSVEGGALRGIENGRLNDLTPYSAAHRQTLCGRLIAFVLPDPNAETIKITAEAEGLPPAVMMINRSDHSIT